MKSSRDSEFAAVSWGSIFALKYQDLSISCVDAVKIVVRPCRSQKITNLDLVFI